MRRDCRKTQILCFPMSNHGPAWACLLRRLAKWECPRFSARLRRSGYLQNGLMRSTEDMPEMRFCQASAFRCRTVFKLLTPQSSPKNQFWEKSDPLRGTSKISIRKDSQAHGFTYSCQVLRKSVKWKWPNGCVVGILLISLELPKRSRQKFYRFTFLHSHLSITFCPNPSCFRGDMSENGLQTHYNIGVKPSRRQKSTVLSW